jgi:hypothetical protein
MGCRTLLADSIDGVLTQVTHAEEHDKYPMNSTPPHGGRQLRALKTVGVIMWCVCVVYCGSLALLFGGSRRARTARRRRRGFLERDRLVEEGIVAVAN